MNRREPPAESAGNSMPGRGNSTGGGPEGGVRRRGPRLLPGGGSLGTGWEGEPLLLYCRQEHVMARARPDYSRGIEGIPTFPVAACNPVNNPVRCLLVSSPYYRRGNRGREGGSVTCPSHTAGKRRSTVPWAPSLLPGPPWRACDGGG